VDAPSLTADGRRVAYSRNEHSNSVLAVQELAPGVPESVDYRGDLGLAGQPLKPHARSRQLICQLFENNRFHKGCK